MNAGERQQRGYSVYSDSNGRDGRLRELDLKSLPYVPLPRAPLRWRQARSGDARKMPEAEDAFEIRDAKWRLTAVQKLPPAERPDPAFRRQYPLDRGLLMIDDLGKTKGLGPIKAAALRYDRDGRVAAKASFAHGIYRLGVHPLGRSLIAMSTDCVLHAYDDDLQPLFETALEPNWLTRRSRSSAKVRRLTRTHFHYNRPSGAD